jgi:hypothetical protein
MLLEDYNEMKTKDAFKDIYLVLGDFNEES